MNEILYERFLEDAKHYEEAEQLWASRFIELLETTGQTDEWETSWMSNNLANGSAIRDGNPIFSARCAGNQLGIRVVQQRPGASTRPLAYLVDIFAEGEPEETSELVISCILTRTTLEQALSLMKEWVLYGSVETERHPVAIDR